MRQGGRQVGPARARGSRALCRMGAGPLGPERSLPEEGPRGPRGLLEDGFVWVVISGPSWEPLIIRKSNKQGNPVFHTQPCPGPSVCVFPLRSPRGCCLIAGCWGEYPLRPREPAGPALGSAGRQHSCPRRPQTKISAGLGRCLSSWGGRELVSSQEEMGLGTEREVSLGFVSEARRVCRGPHAQAPG